MQLSRAILGLVTGCLTLAACGTPESERRIPPSQKVFALDTHYMDYCRSDANTSSDKSAQLEFLRTHSVWVAEHRPNDVWLDHGVELEDERLGLLVRYFAGPKPFNACLFALIMVGDHVGATAMRVRFVRDGQPIQPSDSQQCLSQAPPSFTKAVDGQTLVTLRCDVLATY